MRKGKKIFILIIILEIISFLVIVLFSGKNCFYPTPCSVPNFFHPLGNNYDICIQMLTAPMQCNLSLIYLLDWLILLTIFVFIGYLFKNRKKR